MDKVLVINLTSVTQHVGVIHEDGRKDDIQVVPRRRVELRHGMFVDPAWLGRNPKCVRVVAPQLVVPSVAALRKEPVAEVAGEEQPIADVVAAVADAYEGEDKGDA